VTFVSAYSDFRARCTVTATVVCSLGTLAVFPAAATVNHPRQPRRRHITNNSMVTSNETNPNPTQAVLRQVSDVVAGVGAANPNNAKLKGTYAFFQRVLDANGAMALAGSFVADGLGI